MVFARQHFCVRRKMFSKKSASIRRKTITAPEQLQQSHTGPMLLTAAKLLQLKKSTEISRHHVAGGHSCERSRVQDGGGAEDHSTNLCNCQAAECQGTAV
jgi:hypothetical protein